MVQIVGREEKIVGIWDFCCGEHGFLGFEICLQRVVYMCPKVRVAFVWKGKRLLWVRSFLALC